MPWIVALAVNDPWSLVSLCFSVISALAIYITRLLIEQTRRERSIGEDYKKQRDEAIAALASERAAALAQRDDKLLDALEEAARAVQAMEVNMSLVARAVLPKVPARRNPA